ncbi:hypothetical protein FXO38_13115 [Capsicum annuum]|nr:hypothetical protein FXO38_13115 [Capsicum annuum]
MGGETGHSFYARPQVSGSTSHRMPESGAVQFWPKRVDGISVSCDRLNFPGGLIFGETFSHHESRKPKPLSIPPVNALITSPSNSGEDRKRKNSRGPEGEQQRNGKPNRTTENPQNRCLHSGKSYKPRVMDLIHEMVIIIFTQVLTKLELKLNMLSLMIGEHYIDKVTPLLRKTKIGESAAPSSPLGKGKAVMQDPLLPSKQL